MGRGSRRGRGGGGGFEDQFGEGMVSQDRGDRQFQAGGRGGGSFSGGGEAGGGRKEENFTVSRTVPKFLQGFAHLLGHKPPAEEEDESQLASVDEHEEQAGREEHEDQEALEQAVMQDPDLAQQYPELQPVADKARARHAKEAGNRAFAAKQYEEAVQHFTSALTLHNDPIYFSNRAAAHLALKQYRQAAEDSRHVIALDKKWVKGWSRLAAAHSGLEEWSEAKEAFDEAIRIEPNDASLHSSRHKALVNEAKQEADRVVKFKHSRLQPRPAIKKTKLSTTGSAGTKNKTLLSFDEEEG